MATLLMSSRHTADDQALWRAALRRGWSVERARGLRVPDIHDDEVIIYVEALFAPEIAATLGRTLLDPPEDWLVKLSPAFRRRTVALTTLGAARTMTEPRFVKPPNDKTFKATVFESGAALPEDFDDDSAVLVAEPVRWESEYRCFCLDGSVATLSPYLLAGEHAARHDYEAPANELAEARRFAELVLRDSHGFTPAAVVIDVGVIEGEGWAVVEANGAWGAGIYGCEPDPVLDVIRRATIVPATTTAGQS